MVLAISFVFVSLWLWVVVGLVCCLCLVGDFSNFLGNWVVIVFGLLWWLV